MTLVNQPNKQPVRKVGAYALGGSVASIAMGCLAIFYPEAFDRVPPGFEGGVATMVGFVLAYFIRERV